MNLDFVPTPLRDILLILVGVQYLFNALRAILGFLRSIKRIPQESHTQRHPGLNIKNRQCLKAKGTCREEKDLSPDIR